MEMKGASVFVTVFLALICDKVQGRNDGPLFLTPLIESGQFEQAKALSEVHGLDDAIKSYSGYITVDEVWKSNFFFWFFPAQKAEASNAPLLLWLQGGPGSSSMLGLFVEHGPFYLDSKLNLHRRKYSWNLRYNVLYVDNPVGTGFSFTGNDQGYSKNQSEVGRNMYLFLSQFFQLFSEYKANDFYVSGESYGGKYVPSVAYYIHIMNMLANTDKINLKGITVGNGLSDPLSQFDYGPFLYQIGLADEKQLRHINEETVKARTYIHKKAWKEAFEVFDELINGDKFKYPTYFKNITGLNYYLNYQLSSSPPDLSYFGQYLAQPSVRKHIHVGQQPFHGPSAVETHLIKDIMQSVKPMLEVLINHYKVMIYSGNMDIIIPTSSTKNLIKALDWKHAGDFRNATRHVYKKSAADVQVTGYVKFFNNFYFVVLRNAGHLVPFDQPEAAFDMISRFVDGKPFI